MKDEETIKSYLEYLANVLNYSNNTIIAYQNDITNFNKFVKEEKFAKDLLGIRNDRVIKAYISHLNNMGEAVNSVNRNIASLRGFYNYLLSEKIVDKNFFTDISSLKKPKRLPQIIREKEIVMLLDSCNKQTTLGFRDYLLIEFLYATGLRVSELCSL